MTNINEFSYRIYKQLLNEPTEVNQRTGVGVKALPGITYQTDLLVDGFPLLGLRKLPLNFIPEMMWFLSGQNDPAWLSKHTKIWDSFIDEDGIISSAYGYRWRKHFGFDQLETVLTKLKNEPSSRHGVVMMWSPEDDLLVKQKNVPCPYSMVIGIINNKLNLHVIIRSNDMVLGFPTDCAGFALLQTILTQYLSVNLGTLTVSISNCHIYENQLDSITEMISRDIVLDNVELVLPRNSYKRACNLDDTLVVELKEAFSNYKPFEAIKNIPIAL